MTKITAYDFSTSESVAGDKAFKFGSSKESILAGLDKLRAAIADDSVIWHGITTSQTQTSDDFVSTELKITLTERCEVNP